jgi:septin family protein
MQIVENENHCDFVKLRNLLIRTNNMHGLKDVETNRHSYEKFGSETLASIGHSDDDPHSMSKEMFADQMKMEEENLRKRFFLTFKSNVHIKSVKNK